VNSDGAYAEDESPTSFSSAFQAAGTDDDLSETYCLVQVASRRASGDELLRRARAMAGSTHTGARRRAERDARRALLHYARSLDWAEESDEEEAAHRVMDAAGTWVRQTFGCHLDRRGDRYRQVCPVALAHNRIGLSVGGAATRFCSLCGFDLSECDHLPETAYLVPGGSSELGWCRVCTEASCDHDASQLYRASVVAIIKEMDLQEVSIVGKPAHPRSTDHSVGHLVGRVARRARRPVRPGNGRVV
jgi:hypothetical protein